MTARARRVTEGSPEPLGVTPDGQGVNVAVFSANADAIEFCLFDEAGDTEVERVRLIDRTGDVFHAYVTGVKAGARYGLRAYGPYQPRSGHRFNPAKLLVDPYALAIDRPFRFDRATLGFVPDSDRPDDADSAGAMPKGVVVDPATERPWKGAPEWRHTVLSELHVRGFTKRHPGVPEAIRGTFAGLGSPAAIDHLVKLGITTLELMPAAAWVDERHLPGLGLTNYWGYNPISFLAPDPRLAPGGWAEVRATVDALNGAGIEVLLDVVYNHTGESDEWGPTLSLRGLDNASYYRLQPDDPARYVNDAGCGNILAADRPPVIRLVLDALRAWARLGGMNGFRFDLATTLGRRASGFSTDAPLLAAIEQDPLLRDLKLVAEAWDIGPGGYQVGNFDARWGEWNDQFRDPVRRFWRGDGSAAEIAPRVTGSADRFGRKRRPSRSINYVTAHDGLTLADLVAYSGKHNEPNGEHNRDGHDPNWSWNCGVEGATDDPAIRAGRLRDQRNLLATLLLSRGTPMLGPGTERGLTQNGNNNAYSQDNETTWVEWTSEEGDLTGFIRRLIAIRLGNPALTADSFLTGNHAEGQRFPDIEWRRPDGHTPTGWDWEHPSSRTLIAALNAPQEDEGLPSNRVVMVLQSGFEHLQVVLPEARAGCRWRVVLDTAQTEDGADRVAAGDTAIDVEPRSVVLAVEEPGTVADTAPRAASPEMLDQLARAVGIAPDWIEMNGSRHVVTGDTKVALLSAMGMDVGSVGAIRDSLEKLATTRDRRLLPGTLLAHAGHQPLLRVASRRRLGGRVFLNVAREDGSRERLALDLSREPRLADTGLDGRPAPCFQVALPTQPMGRHRLWLDDEPETLCTLTVAPAACFLPERLLGGGRAFGLAAHLYTLRSVQDQGIGDFTTLARMASAAGHHGASIVGLNPLHVMWPEQRERASPYHPSDRSFLDPLYIDVAAPEIVGETPDVGVLLETQAGHLAELREAKIIRYRDTWALKKQVLQAAFASFGERRRRRPNDTDVRDFERFVTAGGEPLSRFATFMAIMELNGGGDWWHWPTELKTPDAPGVAAFTTAAPERYYFQLYMQWIADRQLAAAAEAGRQAGLDYGFYRDLAVGTAPDGAEAWANQGVYVRGVSVGAPPDFFSASGQTWCLPPPNPVAPGRLWLDTFAGMVSANMRHAGALRIDHAMGLSRLFWIPDGAPGSAGAYVQYFMDAMLGELSLESHRARCMIIGEDLGTVAPGFRERMAEANILSYRVAFFEREKNGLGFEPASAYPAKAVACVATHDLPTLVGWWTGADIDEREAIGSLKPEEAAAGRALRATERGKLAEAIGRPDLASQPEASPALLQALHAFLAATPSMLVMAQADDLVGERDAVNLPGTDQERPNWRRRLDADVTDLLDLPMAKASLPVRPA